MFSLFPALVGGSVADRSALRFGDRSLTYAELAASAGALAARLDGAGRVAVWATPTLETAVGVVAALLAGVPAVPLNPKSGEAELGHILGDSAPSLVLAAPGDVLPSPAGALDRLDVEVSGAKAGAATGGPVPAEGAGATAAVTSSGAAAPPGPVASPGSAGGVTDPGAPALVVYTSGTTGPPKGAVIPRRAIASTLDALADAWQWTGDDVLVHGLPLFHVHGLILGILGPLRRGGSVRHLGRFSAEGVARELNDGATMLFGVPTMYHRLAEALTEDPGLAKALGRARLLVSGSAALPVHDHERITAATGRRVVERYGMTETLMNTSVRVDGEARPGTVGVPLPGVGLRLVEEDGTTIAGYEADGTPTGAYDGESVGEIQVRGPNLFTEYLNRPDATAAAYTGDGWFRTGDMAVLDPDGSVRIVGRKATDLIKSGGYKIGAGEIENALLEHPGVREAAVAGEPDADLGERVVAWIVPVDPQAPPPVDELADHVARRLAPHKRPRAVRFLDELPRNDMGKILKRALPRD
ncbi:MULTISPECIES: acyl-CoA synthetase [unclassified Streptomyces]|uniref:acyl-CoA synthetase n=1 Tax=unclassified Streptomyces TaxID=2593676 RepID=UPI00225B82D6|nr:MULTISPECIES: acyl-CoA synthetase [unclassified Streptomyces]MCX4991129.1 acyl-CoA synthetase [Streptomyces sp. NBC_00568]MCX5003634.1 acyl-CoA synthetase [Streptomyces sp. NBC_00638]